MPKTRRLLAKSEEANAKKSVWWSEGVLLALLTAGAYAVTFAFEVGYCNFFNIPLYLIEPSTGSVLLTAIFLGVASMMLIQLGQVTGVALRFIPSTTLKIRIAFGILLWGIPALLVTSWTWLQLVNLCLMTLVLYLDYIFAFIFKRKLPVVERLKFGDEATKVAVLSPFDPIESALGKTASGGAAFIFLTLLIASVLGALTARSQQWFYVLKEDPTLALVKRYGDRFIGIRYSGTPPTTTGEYVIIPVADEKTSLQYVRLTYLKSKDLQDK